MILGWRSVLSQRADPSPSFVARLPRVSLVLGGARSGKSRYAEALVEAAGADPIYIATAEPRDAEMKDRIRRHRERRGTRWTTIEEPLEIARCIAGEEGASWPMLVDCLTLWLANLLAAGRDVERETDALIDALARRPGPLVFVANEVGLGIVPENALARRFRDDAGRLNQRVAARADRVVFIAAGLPLMLKDAGS